MLGRARYARAMTTETTNRKPYPSDVSDEEWALVAPYLTLMTEDAPQREHSLREVFNGLRWIVRTGAQWPWMPHDLPPWDTGYQQAQRGPRASAAWRATTNACPRRWPGCISWSSPSSCSAASLT